MVVVAGILAVAAGTSQGAYMVDLVGGQRLIVDSYWEEGDRTHLVRGGGELVVPRARIRGMKEVDVRESPSAPSEVARPAARGARDAAVASLPPEDLRMRQAAIERHLLRVQRERFEAEARGDSAAKMRRLNREFERTQQRRVDVLRALERTAPED